MSPTTLPDLCRAHAAPGLRYVWWLNALTVLGVVGAPRPDRITATDEVRSILSRHGLI